MKLLSRFALLCTLLLACSKEKDTNFPREWVRAVQPRLSVVNDWQPCRTTLVPGRVLPVVHCGTPISPQPVSLSCEEMIQSHNAALQALSFAPGCIDTVIATLERYKDTTPSAWSDLAAAYYTRAFQKDRPEDLLSALDAADQAIPLTKQSPDALFNRALIEEALGLDEDAIASYDAFSSREKTTPWAKEALDRRNALSRKPDARRQWDSARAQLPAAARAGDRKKVAQLITPFVGATQKWLEQEVLRNWDLPVATVVAEEWSRVTGDPYMADAVRAIATATPAHREALKKGHEKLAAARDLDEALNWVAAGEQYGDAAEFLERGGSPSWLGAIVGTANAAGVSGDIPSALIRLDQIEAEANRHGYRYLLTRLYSARGFLLGQSSRHVEAIHAYEQAEAAATVVHDFAGIAAFRTNKADHLMTVGSGERAWRERYEAMHYSSQIMDARNRQRMSGVSGRIALALGHPRAAQRYYDAAVRTLRQELRNAPPENKSLISSLSKLIALGLRSRAESEVTLGLRADAQRDLDDSNALIGQVPQTESPVARSLRTRVQEVEGRLSLARDPGRAAESFTAALKNAGEEQMRSIRAGLFILRAEAYRKLQRPADAEQDLRNALAEIRAEEQTILEKRKRGEGEDLWPSYFMRFARLHSQLIRQLLDGNRAEEVFEVADWVRAVEPIDLLLELNIVPKRFRELIGDDRLASKKDLQAVLPEGTFLIQYAVFDDRTFAWVMSRDAFGLVPLEVRRDQIRRWTETLHDAADEGNQVAFREGLQAPYDQLVKAPLAAIAKMPYSNDPERRRIVFVPDEETYGLPFAALRSFDGRYLIQDATVAIAGSATLYAFSLLRDEDLAARQAPASVLLMCYAGEQKSFGLKALPGAVAEVGALQELYGAEAKTFVGSEATAARLFAFAPSSSIVHIAGHALPDAATPSSSTIFLAPTADDDGFVRAAELAEKVRLDSTRLFVFSACSTAGGTAVGREGLAPLVRPVIGAGAPAVVGTLWPVNDLWSKNLLVSFHNHYRSGKDAAAALRAAQLEMIGSGNRPQQPELAWAAFEAIGYAASPSAPAPQLTRRNRQ